MLRASLADIVYLPAKNSSADGVDDHGFEFVSHAHARTDQVEAWLAAGEFRERNRRDFELHAEATRRVAAASDSARVDEFRVLQRRVAVCAESARAPRSSCYWNDNGCGYACLDNLTGISTVPEPHECKPAELITDKRR